MHDDQLTNIKVVDIIKRAGFDIKLELGSPSPVSPLMSPLLAEAFDRQNTATSTSLSSVVASEDQADFTHALSSSSSLK